jgi:hypothetical protein
LSQPARELIAVLGLPYPIVPAALSGVGDVRDIPPASELVARLWREYEEAGA